MSGKQQDTQEYDGNVMQVSFNIRDGWRGAVHFLTGNVAPSKNFAFSFGDNSNKQQQQEPANSTRWSFLRKNNKQQQQISTLQFLLQHMLRMTPLLLLLCAYLAYRYVYLQRREKRYDFVDMAMMRRF